MLPASQSPISEPHLQSDEIHILERLSRPVSSSSDSPTSFWILHSPDFNGSLTDVSEYPDVGASVKASVLFRPDFEDFLRETGTIPEDKISGRYDTQGWSKMNAEAVTGAGMTDDVQYALSNLIRDINQREGGINAGDGFVRTWLITATRQGLRTHVPPPTVGESLIQVPRYRTPSILVEHLADMRSGDNSGTAIAISARVISDWLQTDVNDGDADRRRRKTEWQERKELEKQEDEHSVIVWREWWAV